MVGRCIIVLAVAGALSLEGNAALEQVATLDDCVAEITDFKVSNGSAYVVARTRQLPSPSLSCRKSAPLKPRQFLP